MRRTDYKSLPSDKGTQYRRTLNRYINSDKGTIENMLNDPFWEKVVKNHKFFRLSDEFPVVSSGGRKDNCSNVWDILNMRDVKVEHNAYSPDTYQKNPQDFLKNPIDLHFINGDLELTDSIENYGVVVTDTEDATKRMLTRNWSDSTHEKKPGKWSSVFSPYSSKQTPPSNALILIDRYIFACNPKHQSPSINYKEFYKDGVYNLRCILNELLPKEFSGDSYHVLLVFNDETNNPEHGLETEKIMQRLYDSLSNPRIRGYNITLECLSVRERSKYRSHMYYKTHDRKILSNYYIVKATHGFDAFKKNNGCSKCDQELSFSSLFFGIDNPDQKVESLPYKAIEDTLRDLSEFVQESYNMEQNDYLFFKNGEKAELKQIENRLIKL